MEDDWEEFADENKEIESAANAKKFDDEQLIDHDKEERERKERQELKKELKEEIKKNQTDNKTNEKDYEKLYNERLGIKQEKKNDYTFDELKALNPGFSDSQINDLLSRQSEAKIGNDLFADDGNLKLCFSFPELKGEKVYKKFGEEIAKFISENGNSNNHIPKFFGELFNGLAEKITIAKMQSIIKDFDEKLKKKKKDEEDEKKAEEKILDKKPKNKKPKMGGALKGNNKISKANDVLFQDDDEGEGDYGDEGDTYVNYERDPYDFM
mmetsp:Transcript_22695/g.26054  ORF Transcript_22695/g.26054 Transcript_22695/m.26054 type:complete len:268 (-) Transcript_22695:29-832(-)